MLRLRSGWSVSFAIAALGVLLAACGGDGLSREEFLARANAICAAGNERIDVVASEVFGDLPEGQEPERQQAQRMFDTLVTNIQQQIDGIRELEPPEDMAPSVDAWLDEAQAILSRLEQGGVEGFLDVFRSGAEEPFAGVNEEARRLGLDECGEEG